MPLVGTTLGQYRITEQLGEGGMATVYKAYQPSLDRFVAIKVLPPQHAKTAGFRERFFLEARAVAQLSHPNILPVYDVGMENDICYLVMKCINGCSMRDIMGEKMVLPRVCRFIDQVSGALDHAHGRGIIHRDIKSPNLLLEGEWVFLTDFGIAKIMEGSLVLTGTGELLGTPCYMSPEQASGKPVDHRTDIYSLGIVLYEMITGTVPFKGDTPYGVIYKHIHEPLPMPRSFRPDLPEPVERVILRALAKSPEHRYQSAGQLAEALRAAVASAARDVPTEPLHGPGAREDDGWTRPLDRIAPSQEVVAADIRSPSPSDVRAASGPAIRPNRTSRVVAAGAILLIGAFLFGVLQYLGPYQADQPPPDSSRQEVAAPPPSLPAPEDTSPIARTATLKIESTPQGADVFIEDVLKGKTPVESELPLGRHDIRVMMSGYKDFERVLHLEDAKGYQLIVELVQVGPSASSTTPLDPASSNILKTPFEKGKEDLGKKRYTAALDAFMEAATQGHAESQNEVGYMFMHGLAGRKDLKEAAAWFRKAAAQGLAAAQNNLGILYLKGGAGMQQDDREAFTWFRMAAEQGDGEGQFYLGNMYRFGRGRSRDLEQAAEWYRRAAGQGHEGARVALKTLGK